MPGIIASLLSGGGGGPLGLRKPKGPSIRDHKATGHPKYVGANSIVIDRKSRPFALTMKYDTVVHIKYKLKSDRDGGEGDFGLVEGDSHSLAVDEESIKAIFGSELESITVTQIKPTAETEKAKAKDSTYELGWNNSDYGMPEQSGYGISQYGISQSDSQPILDIMYHR